MYYKELEVWKEARILVTEVYKLVSKFPKTELFGLTSQIKRSVISIPSNIAEGCARHSDKDTLRFLEIASGSLAELDTQLLIAEDLGYIKYDSNLENKLKKVNALIIGMKKFLHET